jgi:hypothetical protein
MGGEQAKRIRENEKNEAHSRNERQLPAAGKQSPRGI